jgi:hypothetical protein
MTWQQLGEGLDRAWLAYMKDRPLTARGYLENTHGKWMRGQAVQMIAEDDTVRARASEGTLLAPDENLASPRRTCLRFEISGEVRSNEVQLSPAGGHFPTAVHPDSIAPDVARAFVPKPRL